eukprot:gene54272-4018_t
MGEMMKDMFKDHASVDAYRLKLLSKEDFYLRMNRVDDGVPTPKRKKRRVTFSRERDVAEHPGGPLPDEPPEPELGDAKSKPKMELPRSYTRGKDPVVGKSLQQNRSRVSFVADPPPERGPPPSQPVAAELMFICDKNGVKYERSENRLPDDRKLSKCLVAKWRDASGFDIPWDEAI